MGIKAETSIEMEHAEIIGVDTMKERECQTQNRVEEKATKMVPMYHHITVLSDQVVQGLKKCSINC